MYTVIPNKRDFHPSKGGGRKTPHHPTRSFVAGGFCVVCVGGAGGDDDDGYRRFVFGAEFFEEFETAHAGKIQIEDDEVGRRVRFQFFERIFRRTER